MLLEKKNHCKSILTHLKNNKNFFFKSLFNTTSSYAQLVYGLKQTTSKLKHRKLTPQKRTDNNDNNVWLLLWVDLFKRIKLTAVLAPWENTHSSGFSFQFSSPFCQANMSPSAKRTNESCTGAQTSEPNRYHQRMSIQSSMLASYSLASACEKTWISRHIKGPARFNICRNSNEMTPYRIWSSTNQISDRIFSASWY